MAYIFKSIAATQFCSNMLFSYYLHTYNMVSSYIPRRKSGIYWIQVRRAAAAAAAAAAVEISLWTR